jgi:hypothetical protein
MVASISSALKRGVLCPALLCSPAVFGCAGSGVGTYARSGRRLVRQGQVATTTLILIM